MRNEDVLGKLAFLLWVFLRAVAVIIWVGSIVEVIFHVSKFLLPFGLQGFFKLDHVSLCYSVCS